jgi:hypothetical protein
MHKNATKCNEIVGKWYKNKHGASKIIDTFEMYHGAFLQLDGPLLHRDFFLHLHGGKIFASLIN